MSQCYFSSGGTCVCAPGAQWGARVVLNAPSSSKMGRRKRLNWMSRQSKIYYIKWLTQNQCVCVRAFSDVDECVNGSRCVNGTCSNTEGSYICHCDAGYRLEPTDQTCQGKNLESKTICFLYHPPPTSSLLIGLLMCWLVGCAVCQILMSVLTWGRLFVGFGPVRTHRALTNVRCPVHLAFPEANTASASVSAHRHQLQPWCHRLSSTQLALLYCTSPYSGSDQSCLFVSCGLIIC